MLICFFSASSGYKAKVISTIVKQEAIKHRDELGKALRIISELGYVPNDSMKMPYG